MYYLSLFALGLCCFDCGGEGIDLKIKKHAFSIMQVLSSEQRHFVLAPHPPGASTEQRWSQQVVFLFVV
jgi:hypothetical protein